MDQSATTREWLGWLTRVRLLTILLILGVDAVMDMARTAVNVTGNCLACAVIARWEGELDTNPQLSATALKA